MTGSLSPLAGESMDTGFGHQFLDEPDERDKTWDDCKKDHPDLQVPRESGAGVDLRKFCSPVRDQGLLDACVGFALAGLVEFLRRKRDRKDQFVVSPRFIWYFARLSDFHQSTNTGAQLRNGMRVLAHAGCCAEHLDPYDPDAYMPRPTAEQFFQAAAILNEASARRPSVEAVAEARNLVIGRYYRLDSLDDYRECLDFGYGFVMACPMFRSVLDDVTDKSNVTGRFPMPDPSKEKPDGWHSMLVVGYEADTDYEGGGYLLCKGSQGPDRGDKGYFRVPYEYVNRWPGSAWTAIDLPDIGGERR